MKNKVYCNRQGKIVWLRWLSSRKSTCCIGDTNSIPGSGRSPGEGNGNPLQYSRLENSMDRGAWQATVLPWGHKESDTTEQLILSLSSDCFSFSPRCTARLNFPSSFTLQYSYLVNSCQWNVDGITAITTGMCMLFGHCVTS